MKIVIAPDKFKGNLSSFEVCEAIGNSIKRKFPGAEILSFPMADGGDGFASVLEYYYGTEKIPINSVDPLGRLIETFYQWERRERTAIIELASASGLALLKKDDRTPLKTSTYGTGILIRDAIGKGAERIILGIGGSATNDGGIGIMKALGFKFLDNDKREVADCGAGLSLIHHIIPPEKIPTINFEIAADVRNVLYGSSGAAFIYAAQKGASDKEIKILDDGLRNFATVLLRETGNDVSIIAGAGAAGGAAAGLMAYFNIVMKSGVELVIEASKIEVSLKDADLIITGEGKLDQQTALGKVVSRIAALAKARNIDCVAACGVSDLDEQELVKLGIKKILAIRDYASSQKESFIMAKEILEEHAASLVLK